MSSHSPNRYAVLGTIMIGVVAAFMFVRALGKIGGWEHSELVFETLGIGSARFPLGVLQLLAAFLLISRRGRRVGILLSSAYLGGAFIVVLIFGGSGGIIALGLLLLWVGSALVLPQNPWHNPGNQTPAEPAPKTRRASARKPRKPLNSLTH